MDDSHLLPGSGWDTDLLALAWDRLRRLDYWAVDDIRGGHLMLVTTGRVTVATLDITASQKRVV